MRMVWEIVRTHFDNHLKRSPLAFALLMGVEGFVVSAILGTALVAGGSSTRRDLTNLGYFDGFLLLVIAAPLIETLIFQLLPIAFARLWRLKSVGQIVVSTSLFAAAHFPAGLTSGICAGILGGFYLALGYTHWAVKSDWTAFWTTTLQHLMRNLVGYVLLLSAGELTDPANVLHPNTATGSKCHINVWYFTRLGDGEFQFAIAFANAEGGRQTLYPLSLDGFIRKTFQIQFDGRCVDIEYSEQDRTVTVGGDEFDLRECNTILIRIEGNQFAMQPLQAPIESNALHVEPLHVLHKVCETMQNEGLEPKTNRKADRVQPEDPNTEPTN